MDPRALPVDVAVTTDELAHIQTLGREPRRACPASLPYPKLGLELFATGRAA